MASQPPCCLWINSWLDEHTGFIPDPDLREANLNNSDWHCVCLEQVPHILPGVCGCVQQHCLRDLQMLEALVGVALRRQTLLEDFSLIPSTSRPERPDMLLEIYSSSCM